MDPSNVQDLASPPLIDRLFLVDPVPTALAALFLGILFFEILRRRRKDRYATLAFAAGVGLGTAILLIGAGVETPHEQVRRETEHFVDRAVSGDRDAVERILAERVVVAVSANEAARSRDWLLGIIEQLDKFIFNNRLRWRGAEIHSQQTAISRVTLQTEIKSSGYISHPFSTWDFHWRLDTTDHWRVVKIEAISIAGQKPSHNWTGQVPFPIRNMQ